MGVRAELMPADFAQAKVFYEKVKSRQAGPSVQGPKLMRSLVMFLQDYLPPFLMRDLPLMLVGTQLGTKELADITPPGTRTPPLGIRLLVKSGFVFLKLYYVAKHLLIDWIPPLRTALGSAFAHAGDALIDSWRDGYQRRPFFIPDSVGGGWHREAGYDRVVAQKLRRWRIELFGQVVKSVGLIIAATLLTIVASLTIFLIFGTPWWSLGLPLLTLICWIMGLYGLTWGVAAVVRRRPGPAAPPIVEKQATRAEAASS
jgi:hypothetical protein